MENCLVHFHVVRRFSIRYPVVVGRVIPSKYTREKGWLWVTFLFQCFDENYIRDNISNKFFHILTSSTFMHVTLGRKQFHLVPILGADYNFPSLGKIRRLIVKASYFRCECTYMNCSRFHYGKGVLKCLKILNQLSSSFKRLAKLYSWWSKREYAVY